MSHVKLLVNNSRKEYVGARRDPALWLEHEVRKHHSWYELQCVDPVLGIKVATLMQFTGKENSCNDAAKKVLSNAGYATDFAEWDNIGKLKWFTRALPIYGYVEDAPLPEIKITLRSMRRGMLEILGQCINKKSGLDVTLFTGYISGKRPAGVRERLEELGYSTGFAEWGGDGQMLGLSDVGIFVEEKTDEADKRSQHGKHVPGLDIMPIIPGQFGFGFAIVCRDLQTKELLTTLLAFPLYKIQPDQNEPGYVAPARAKDELSDNGYVTDFAEWGNDGEFKHFV